MGFGAATDTMNAIDRAAERAAQRRNAKASKAVQAALERDHHGKWVVFRDKKLFGLCPTMVSIHAPAREATCRR